MTYPIWGIFDMEIYCKIEALEELCIKAKQWILYFSWDTDLLSGGVTYEEVQKAIPFLTVEEISWTFGNGYIFCNSEEEANEMFYQIVGDDGPTKFNSYNGEVKVYACTIGPMGFGVENT